MSNPGTSAWLRTQNDLAAFRLLLEHGPLSRSRLSELSGLSKPTAGLVLTRLHGLGLVGAAGAASGTRGPSAVTYAVRSNAVTGVAISVLADSIDAVLVDPIDTAYPLVELPLDELEQRSPVADVRAAVTAACAAAGADPASVSVVSLGVQAAVDEDADRLSCIDTLPGWPMSGAHAMIERETGFTVRLENDVNLAALAERRMPAVRDLPSFAYLWLGQGLGVGIDIDGVVRRGAFRSAGEIGYLEAPRSALALDPTAKDFTDLMGGAAMVRMLGGAPGQRLRDALPRLRDDAAALDAFAHRVALLVSPILTVLDPGAFILGGPTALAAGPRLAELVQARVAADRHPHIEPSSVWAREHVDVRMCQAGPQPILQGARVMLVAQLRELLEARIQDSIAA